MHHKESSFVRIFKNVKLITFALGLFLATQPGVQAQTFKVIYNFTGGLDGASPWAGLTRDTAGNFYGSAAAGGGNWAETVLYSFAGGNDRAVPDDGLLLDNSGNLYGTTRHGGGSVACSTGCGTVFELTPSGSGWAEKILYSFQGGSDGENPDAGLISDPSGNLYGITWQGGSGGGGTVFETSALRRRLVAEGALQPGFRSHIN